VQMLHNSKCDIQIFNCCTNNRATSVLSCDQLLKFEIVQTLIFFYFFYFKNLKLQCDHFVSKLRDDRILKFEI